MVHSDEDSKVTAQTQSLQTQEDSLQLRKQSSEEADPSVVGTKKEGEEFIIDKKDTVNEEEKVSTIVEDESPRSPVKIVDEQVKQES